MKRVWLFLVMIGFVTAPALCQAGAPPDYSPCAFLSKASETELAQNTGYGIDRQGDVHNQEGRIVIWDEWAHSAMTGAKASGRPLHDKALLITVSSAPPSAPRPNKGGSTRKGRVNN